MTLGVFFFTGRHSDYQCGDTFYPGWNGVELQFHPPGGRYGLCLHEIKLLGPGEIRPSLPDATPAR
ncbi:MAG: hypothetical protein MUF04_01505 [Akkermansiaceae bacterium]|jgi:hypothetical protein|nr:hypothetical protein [Akkermansiaceae bacterium]